MRRRLVAAALALAVVAPVAEARRLELGLSDPPGGADELRRAAPFGYRYQ